MSTALAVVVLLGVTGCGTLEQRSQPFRFEEVSGSAFSNREVPTLAECYRNLRLQDSIERPDARRLTPVEPLQIRDGEIVGDIDNLPRHYTSSELYECDRAIGSPSLAVVDIDRDGDDDLIESPNVLHLNNGDATFRPVELPLAVAESTDDASSVTTPTLERQPSKPLAFDLDNDGLLEIMVSYSVGVTNQLFTVFRQDGGDATEWRVDPSVSFTSTRPFVSSVQAISVVDYDRDGFDDVVVGLFAGHLTNYRNRVDGFDNTGLFLLRNDGGRRFVDVSEETGIRRLVREAVDYNRYQGTYAAMVDEITWVHAVSTADLDNDGFADLLVAGDFGTGMLLWNDGGRGFTLEPGIDFLGHSLMGPALTDINGDGYLDLFVSQVHTKLSRRWTCAGGRPCDNERLGNFWWVSDGPRRYTDRAVDSGLLDGGWGWGATFVDLDNDGVEELVQAAGVPGVSTPAMPGFDHRADPIRLWSTFGRLDPDRWTDVAADAGLVRPITTLSVASGDFDGDGLADLVVGSAEIGRPLLFLNRSDRAGNWVAVTPVREQSGRLVPVFGARVEVSYRMADGTERTALRYSGTQSQSYYSNSGALSWFGVGPDRTVRVTVHWPDGTSTTWSDLAVNRRHELAAGR